MTPMDRHSTQNPEIHPQAHLETLGPERLKSIRVYEYFSFILWPFFLIGGLFAALLVLIQGIFTKPKEAMIKIRRVYLPLILLPWNLLKLVWDKKNAKVIFGLLLLLPFMITSVLSLYSAFFPEHIAVSGEILKPPGLHHFMGTNGEGIGIGGLIVTGARHTYLTSLISTGLVLLIGLWLGKMTFHRKRDPIIMGAVEILETIPVLFFLLIVLAVFSWWEDVWRLTHIGTFLIPLVRVIVIGTGIGLCFLPRMIRLIRERINTFINQDFIDGTKAHGIEQNRILWFHIIKKNCLTDVIITVTQIWAAAILIEISLDYLITISPLLGAKIYESWSGMLLTFEVRDAVINNLPRFRLGHWWLYAFPGYFIVSTVIGFYLYGEGLGSVYHQKASIGKASTTDLDRSFNGLVKKMGIDE